MGKLEAAKENQIEIAKTTFFAPPPPKKKTKTKTKKSVSVFYCKLKPHVAGQNQMEALLKTNCWFFNAKWTRSGCNEVVSGVGVE